MQVYVWIMCNKRNIRIHHKHKLNLDYERKKTESKRNFPYFIFFIFFLFLRKLLNTSMIINFTTSIKQNKNTYKTQKIIEFITNLNKFKLKNIIFF